MIIIIIINYSISIINIFAMFHYLEKCIFIFKKILSLKNSTVIIMYNVSR